MQEAPPEPSQAAKAILHKLLGRLGGGKAHRMVDCHDPFPVLMEPSAPTQREIFFSVPRMGTQTQSDSSQI